MLIYWIGDIFVTQKLTNFFKSPKFSPKLVKNLPKIQITNIFTKNCENFGIYETTLIFYKIVTNFGDSLEFSPIFVTKNPKSKEIIVTRIGDIFFTQKLTNFFKSLEFSLKLVTKRTQNRKELLSPELVIFLSLKNSPISSNHRNFHQNWWQKNPKIGRNYCHQNWWHFRHSKTHQFLQFTKNVTKIGEKFGENSIENSNHQNFHQNWWKFWRKFNRKWMWAPTSREEDNVAKLQFIVFQKFCMDWILLS